MDRLTSPMERREQKNDIDTGQNENPEGRRGRGRRRTEGDRAKGQEGRGRAQSRGGCQIERRRTNGRGGEWMCGRGRGGEPGIGGAGKESRDGARCEGVRWRGKGGADAGRQRGGAGKESKDGLGGEGVQGRGKGGGGADAGRQRGGAGKESKDGVGEGVRGRGKGGGGADAGRQRGGAGKESKDGVGGEGLRGRGKGGGAADAGGQRGGAGKESKDGVGGEGLRGRGKGGQAADAGGQRGGAGKKTEDGAGGEGKGRRTGEGAEGETGAAVRKRARELAEMGARRGGHSEDGRGRQRGDGVGDKKERNEGRHGAPQGHGLGYKRLEELSGEDPSAVAITLTSLPALQYILSETTMRTDLVELLCRLLSKAFKARTIRGTLKHLAGMIKDSGFFRTILPHYLAGIQTEFDPVRRAQYPQHVENILAFLSQVHSMFPASSVQTLSLLLTQLQASINSLKTSGVAILPQTEASMARLQGVRRHLQERPRERNPRSSRTTPPSADEVEQQDFRTIPIYLTAQELHRDQKPFLQPNLISQRYANTHLYLDTHFRLLREDLIQPLREGIQQLLLHPMSCVNQLKKKRFDDISIYFDTKLLMPKCTRTGLAHIVQFDIQPLKSVRWQDSKRLIFGSLVVLSCDYFESFLFATVSESNPNDLQKGKLQITFTEESRSKLAEVQMDQLFLMVENTAFFEAYRYVLDGLKELGEDNLPFQRYIVECNADVQPPAYLQRTDTYDLHYIALPEYHKRLRPFHSLKEEAWPRKEKLGLDESQMKALKLALTKELAIIQGPPGTGKTYVGLKIAQALLTNQSLWKNSFGTAPMLVVCFTNHALDQFLEGIFKFLKEGLVRVGGRSSSTILQPFNLRELMQSPSFKRSLPSHLTRAYKQIFKQLDFEERKIKKHIKELECSLNQILPESVLQMFISDRHWNNLQKPPAQDVCKVPAEKSSSLIGEWLCLDSTNLLQRETQDANRKEDGAAAAEARQTEEEDLIEIAEEADLIQQERIIEDDIESRVGRDSRKEGDTETAVIKIEELMLDLNLDEDDIEAEQRMEEWKMQQEQMKKIKKRIMMEELGKNSAMTEEEEGSVQDIWTLSLTDRWRLYRLWLARYRAILFTRVLEFDEDYQNAVDRLTEVRQRERVCLLRNAKVIGMTTTGAAKYRQILQEVHPCLVIVEEAAEVLEAHTITSLSQACQHLILIGDHQQLRPSTTVHELGKYFNLDVSMFERLVKMGLPFARLSLQHRMRPEIARLLTPHIYSELKNHPSVFKYENIKGLDTNLFFVEHCHPEEAIKDGTSHQNKHEAMFVVALCRYLLLQDYKPEQITILTTYAGQLHCLRRLMPVHQFEGVQVHVVDSYQGEENDIVLLSLVRSNTRGKVGFLSIPNRVCVALSRAKKGLYCIGNSTLLGQVKLWRNIFDTLREKDQVGNALTLRCQNHPDQQVKASCAEDFKQAPEGGCTQPCNFHLDCGHVCLKLCHLYDPEHKMYKCPKKCQRTLCDLGHVCARLCHEECPTCPVKVGKIIPQCQHTQMVPCHQDPNTFECQWHSKLSCGHIQQLACFLKTETDEPICRTPCKIQLKCGRTCHGTCSKCYQGRFHVPCPHWCERLLVCSHKSRQPCSDNYQPCQRPCENRCVHTKCMKPCGKPCVPCVEPCAWQCPHQSCSKLCHEPCDRPPCTQPCARSLICGHPCIGLCGDKCPSKCRICNHDEVAEIFSGTENDPEAHFVQLEDCGHIFEYKAMDTYMGMNDNQQENEGEWAVLKLKECPRCQTPIRRNLRYGSHINSSLAEIEMVKRKINRKTYFTTNDLWVQENKLDLFAKLKQLWKIRKEDLYHFQEQLSIGQHFTDQQVFDMQRATETRPPDRTQRLLGYGRQEDKVTKFSRRHKP